MAKNIEVFYYKNKSKQYYCKATQEECPKVTKYFKQWNDKIKFMAENNINTVIYEPLDSNVCTELNCNLYTYIQNLKKITEIQK